MLSEILSGFISAALVLGILYFFIVCLFVEQKPVVVPSASIDQNVAADAEISLQQLSAPATPAWGALTGIHFIPSEEDAERCTLHRLETNDAASTLKWLQETHSNAFCVVDRLQDVIIIYKPSRFLGAKLVNDARYDLCAPLLEKESVQLTSNHVRTAVNRTRYAQWQETLVEICDLSASQFNYRLVASLFSCPTVWMYQTNTDEHGTPFNNKIMDASVEPLLNVYRTWYCWQRAPAQ